MSRTFFDSFMKNGNANVADWKLKRLSDVGPAHLCIIIHLFQGVDAFSITAARTPCLH